MKTTIGSNLNKFELPVVGRSMKDADLSYLAKIISGGAGRNYLLGTDSSDIIYGGSGNDTIIDDHGNDKLYGEAGADYLDGGFGADLLDGGSGSDTLLGLEGNDKLYGRAGNDKLHGGSGTNTLVGGAGRDTFFFEDSLKGIDKIMDFSSAADTIKLDAELFQGLTAGVLNPGSFVRGRVAADADDRILYDRATGYIYYDPDGNGGAAAIAFARNMKKSAMSSDDFVIF